MNLTHEYLRHRKGYSFGAGCCWIRIYEGATGDAPVVVCEELPEAAGSASVTEMSSQLAAEIITDHFTGTLPDLPRPMLWIEHHPRRRGPGRFYLISFPSYHPYHEGVGFIRRMTLGPPTHMPLTPAEAAILIREA
ncbi:MAG: hypothetical protein H0U04_02095 [Rubrobacter sp.]|nr:hypothetical protein [Rubrobacter sp.]